MKPKPAWTDHLRAFGLLIVLSGFAACGGGGGGGDDNGGDAPVTTGIFVREPTHDGTGVTRTLAASLRFHGDGFISPGDVDCEDVFPDPLTVQWRNEATGQTGSGFTSASCVTTIFGTFPNSKWTIREGEIELAVGLNRIVLTVTDRYRNSSSITLQVERLADDVPPVITSRAPAPDAVDFAVNRSLSVRFSEDMLPSSLTQGRFVLTDDLGAEVSGLRRYDEGNFVWTLDPTSDLSFSSAYTVTIYGDVEDLYGGNTLGADQSWSFTTAANPDVTPPSVTRVSPEPAAQCAAPDVPIVAAFDEPIDSSTVNNVTFFVVREDGLVLFATHEYDGNVARLLPDLPLSPGTRYDATLRTGISDLAGNGLAADFTWSFSTGVAVPPGTWAQTAMANAPLPRSQHTAVWTGSEMIVFGGRAFEAGAFRDTNSGGRYDPVANAWIPTSTTDAPSLSAHEAVWTGTEMIVWGRGAGARYNPATDTWQPMSLTGAPSGRSRHAAVWTGAEMIVWGGELPGAGSIGTPVGTGGRYDPSTDTWLAMSTTGAPSPRVGMAAVWTGSEFVVWGGVAQRPGGMQLTDGARYDPTTDSWTSLPATDAAGGSHIAGIWTGSEVLIWNGGSITTVDSGGFTVAEATVRLFDPIADSWRTTTNLCEPYLGASGYHAHWTGSRLFVWANDPTWGGHFYDPAADSWQASETLGGPPVRSDAASVWAGNRFILWGGSEVFGGFQSSGFVLEE